MEIWPRFQAQSHGQYCAQEIPCTGDLSSSSEPLSYNKKKNGQPNIPCRTVSNGRTYLPNGFESPCLFEAMLPKVSIKRIVYAVRHLLSRRADLIGCFESIVLLGLVPSQDTTAHATAYRT